MRQYTVEFVQAVIAHHQPPLAALGVLDGDPGTQLLGQVILQPAYVWIQCTASGFRSRAMGLCRSLSF